MADPVDRLRRVLKLPEGVLMTDEEMDRAVGKAPKAQRDALRSELIRYRADRDTQIAEREKAKKPRRFGGLA